MHLSDSRPSPPECGTSRERLRREWRRRGTLGPLPVLTRPEAARVASLFREQYAASGRTLTRNRHADLPVLSALCADPRVWATAHDILGDALLLWRTNVFLDDPALPWHEDRHAGLFAQDAFSLSVLLALEDSPPDNCTVLVPGSHLLAVPEKEREYGIVARYQKFGNVRYAGEVPARLHAPATLAAGEAALLHPELLHASSGFLRPGVPPSSARMSCAFRVTTPEVEVREAAFPGAGERAERVLRVIRRGGRLS